MIKFLAWMFILAQVLYRALRGHIYLIAVDDIWNNETRQDIKRSFPNDNTDSRNILISRIKYVALHAISGGCLLCMHLSRKKSVSMRSYYNKLNDTGKITKKCCDLPLAIVVIAEL